MLSACKEDDYYAESKTAVQRVASFFDRRHPANHVGIAQIQRDPPAYAVPWQTQLQNPNIPKMSVPLPESPVDYEHCRVRRKTLVVDCAWTVAALGSGTGRLRAVVSSADLHKMFIRCTEPAHRHRVALLQVDLTQFVTTGVIASQPLHATLDMISPHPDPQPTNVEALTERSWFNHDVHHIRPEAKETVGYACHLLCNSDRQSMHQALNLYTDTWGTGLSTFTYFEALNRGFAGMTLGETTHGHVVVEPPVATNQMNIAHNPMSVWMLEYLKLHGLQKPLVDPKSNHFLLEKHMYDDICKELTIKTKRGSCMLEHDVTFEFTLIHPDQWVKAFKGAQPTKVLSFVATLDLVAVVLGY